MFAKDQLHLKLGPKAKYWRWTTISTLDSLVELLSHRPVDVNVRSRIRGDFTWNVLETEVHLDLPLKTTSECTSFFNGEYRKLKFLGKDFYGEPIWRCQFQWSFHGSKDFEMHGGKNIEANGRFGVMVTPLSCNLREIIIWLMVNNALHIICLANDFK